MPTITSNVMYSTLIIFSVLLCSGLGQETKDDLADQIHLEPGVFSENTDKPLQLGCKDLGRCCQGRNSSCYVGNRIGDATWKNCYCDAECMQTGDCCADHKDYCQAVDCEVSAWDEWGNCSRLCGHGTTNRTRTVVTHAANGGQKCPHLTETRKCFGHDCNTKRDTSRRAIRETGRILPIRFATYRTSTKYDIRKGIRKNLYDYYHSQNSILSKPTYCATYVITYSLPHCQRSHYGDWAKDLRAGTQLCVECQSNAMHQSLDGRCKGDGVQERDTRWKAVGVAACAGFWKMITEHKECNCNEQNDNSFIFV